MKQMMLLFLLVGGSLLGTSQNHLLFLHPITQNNVERSLDSNAAHLGMKPFLQSAFNLERTKGFAKDSAKYYYPLGVKIWRDHLIKIEKEDFRFYIDPLFDFMLTTDFADTSEYRDSVRLLTNTRGLLLQGDIGHALSFQTGFLENQVHLPLFQKAMADSLEVIPGMGRWKVYKTSGYDYSMSFGYLSIKARPWLNLVMGYGKNFIGHGYRSLLLSDAAFSYPYLRGTASTKNKKIQYTSIYASLQTLQRMPLGEVPESLFKRKAASFNYLSWTPMSRLELGLFEGIIWQRWDSTGTQALPWNAFMPVIGLNSALNGWNGVQNVVTGLNIRYRLLDHLNVYGQFLLDDPATEKSGYQLGFKWLDVLPGLDLQVEWNSISDHTYSSSYALQNYEHYNQPLGHPTGPGTEEWIGILHYRYKQWYFRLKGNGIQHAGGPRGDIFNLNPSEGSSDSLYSSVQTIMWEFETGFFINPKTNMQILVGFTDRTSKWTDMKSHGSLVYVAWRTSLFGRYFDF